MALSPELLLRIQTVVADAHNAFIANFVSPRAVPAEVLERLRAQGKLNPQAQVLADAYLTGRLQAQISQPAVPGQAAAGAPPSAASAPAAGEPAAAAQPYVAGKPSTGAPVPKEAGGREMDYEDVRRHLARQPVPLSSAEQEGIRLNEVRAAQYLRGLGNRVEAQTAAILIQQDAVQEAAYRKIVTDKVSQNIARRQSLRQLRSELGHATGDWARDLDRIALTEKHAALQAGVAEGLARRNGPEARVAVLTSPGSCASCLKLYREDDQRPKVFELASLPPSAVNVGRKTAQWVACRPPLHPNCFPAGTLVTTARGSVPVEQVTTSDLVLTHRNRWRRVVQLHRNAYDGPLHWVGGVAMTADHPVLTSGGWLAAQSIENGAHLLRRRGEVRAAESHHHPTLLQQAGQFAPFLRDFLGLMAPVPGEDFDGQPSGRFAEIDAVGVESQLWGEFQPVRPESFQEFLLQLAEPGARLAGQGPFPQGLSRVLHAADSGVGGRGVGHALSDGKPAVAQSLGFARGAAGQSVLVHKPNEGRPGDPEALRHGQYGHPLDDVQSVKEIFIERARSGHFDAIAHRRKATKPFSGTVYNLSVWQDESYFAGGIAVHNCLCSLVPIPAGMQVDAEGRLEARKGGRRAGGEGGGEPLRKGGPSRVKLRLGPRGRPGPV